MLLKPALLQSRVASDSKQCNIRGTGYSHFFTIQLRGFGFNWLVA